ncbi:hypothetical protein AX16_005363 [Volvariella volvacea WC 439]|nr:hypothetical protein AX16_005363 [Volvariella volvacea WC 439]
MAITLDGLVDDVSDLWVAHSGSVPNSRFTGYTSGVNYAVGSVRGPVKTATLEFAGFTVPDQAFLEIQPDAENRAGEGLIGLGPNVGSKILQTMGTVEGAPVLDRIFLQNRTTANFMTVLMGRKEDPTDFYSGTLTVGEVLEEYEAVLDEPQLLVSDVPIHEIGDQHFQVLLDEDGLIGPDGQPIEMRTRVDETTNKRRTMAVVDTGFSLPQLPKTASDAIYSRIDGAEFGLVANVGEVWIIPCDREVNITFKFAGKRYPIHPLDASLDPTLLGLPRIRNSRGQACCIGTFQPFSFATGPSPNYDIILGMAFLRNVYMLVDYGDFVVGSTERDDPYIQFLSTTEVEEAHRDFVQVRLGGVDTTGDQTLDSNTNNTTPSDSGGGSNAVYYVIAAVSIVAALALVGCFILYRRRKSKSRSRLSDHSHTAPQMMASPNRVVAYPPPPLRQNDSYPPPPAYGQPSSPLLASTPPTSHQSHQSYGYQPQVQQPQQVYEPDHRKSTSQYYGSR